MRITPSRLQWLSRLICASAAALFFVLAAQAQTNAILSPIGGSGGAQFVARCPKAWYLTGFELRTGDDVDAIRPLCVIATGPSETTDPMLTKGSGLVTSRNMLRLADGWYGGIGGGLRNIICPRDAPIVTGMYVRAEGVDNIIVNNIHLFCGLAATTQTPSDLPSAVFDGPNYKHSEGFLGIGIGGDLPDVFMDTQRCPAGLVAVGINGRSGKWLDSVGLICGRPELVRKSDDKLCIPGLMNCDRRQPNRRPPVGSIGRIRGTPTTDTRRMSICDRARDARARNSPVAPDLEAQCRALGAAGEAPAPDATQQYDLATKGEAIVNRDPLSAELRNQQPDGLARRGFDIGMAAAEGQTAPGPGKQRIHDSLSPGEQRGFEIAVAFSLERNRNADFASRGAAIAEADPTVAEARIAEANVFYWLGFDIATGIFGDPALGAQGNTATGTGSMRIRDSLSVAGQRGFNAAVKLHLSRNYKQ